MSRRSARQQERRRSRLLSLGLLTSFLLLMTAAGIQGMRYLLDPDHFPVRTVRIENRFHHLDRDALQRTLGAAVDGGFFGVDLERVRQAALSLPWVARASVRRVWPDRLVVEVEEQVPVAHWNDRGLVTAGGTVFYPEKPVKLRLGLHFRGPENKAAEMLAFYGRVAPGLAARGLRIREVKLDRRGEWQFRMHDGATLMVGREQKEFRIERLLGVFAVLAESERQIERIDLRYEQGFAVRWRPREKS